MITIDARPSPHWVDPLYLDASALAKLFVQAAEIESLNEALLGARGVILSDLALTEMTSALGRRTREGILTRPQASRLHREALKLTTSCRHVEITPHIHRRADRRMGRGYFDGRRSVYPRLS